MYIQSMSNDTIHINSQTLTPIGENGDVYFKITSLEDKTSGKDLKCVIDCGSSTVDSGTMASGEISILKIATGINATNVTPTSSSLGMIKINLKFSEVLLLDLKYLSKHDATVLDFGEAGKIETNSIPGTTFYVSDIDGLLKLSALVGKVNTKTEDGSNYGSNYGYNNSAGEAVTFKGATIQMLNDIDCENNKDNFSKKFIPIGNATNSFRGTFDGNDKTITGLYIDQTTYYAGLFGYVLDAEIKNLKMQNCKVVGASYVGNFVGYANNKLISNCSAEGTEVSGSNYVGGIVGCVYGTATTATITNCYNTGSVSGNKNIGGIVGEVDGTATITNCYNTGSVSGTGDYVGGIVGMAYNTTITNCYNTESVGGGWRVGGIVGDVDGTTTIINCYNCSNWISGGEYVGGIVGHSSGTVTVANCYNLGETSSGRESDGGIVGVISSGSFGIYNCYYLNTQSFSPIGMGSSLSDSYFGVFDKNQTISLKRGVLPVELGSSLNLINLLNAWIEDKKETYGNLKNWKQDENNVNNGYPVFMEN